MIGQGSLWSELQTWNAIAFKVVRSFFGTAVPLDDHHPETIV